MGTIRRTRKLAGLATLTVLTAAAATIIGVPASAIPVPPVLTAPVTTAEEERSTTERVDSNGRSYKEVTAYCRGGKKLIGVGYSHSGDSGVVIDEATPLVNRPGDDDQVTVKAYETPAGTPYTWWVRAKAICASGLANVQLVTLPSAIDTSTPKTVVAECPSGKKVIGTSFEALSAGAPGEVIVTAVNPINGGSAGRDTVSVTAHPDDDGITGTWGVTAHAFCATPPSGWEIRAELQNPADTPSSSATVQEWCPAGTVGLGAGWSFSNVAGVAAGNVLLTNLSVLGPMTVGPNSQYVATAQGREDADGTSADWALTVKVMCATA